MANLRALRNAPGIASPEMTLTTTAPLPCPTLPRTGRGEPKLLPVHHHFPCNMRAADADVRGSGDDGYAASCRPPGVDGSELGDAHPGADEDGEATGSARPRARALARHMPPQPPLRPPAAGPRGGRGVGRSPSRAGRRAAAPDATRASFAASNMHCAVQRGAGDFCTTRRSRTSTRTRTNPTWTTAWRRRDVRTGG